MIPKMNILDEFAIRLRCTRCGGNYEVPLSDVLLSHKMLHDGCPVTQETECPPLAQARLFPQGSLEALATAWSALEQQAGKAGGELVVLAIRKRAA